jgi:hypothetical protein
LHAARIATTTSTSAWDRFGPRAYPATRP